MVNWQVFRLSRYRRYIEALFPQLGSLDLLHDQAVFSLMGSLASDALILSELDKSTAKLQEVLGHRESAIVEGVVVLLSAILSVKCRVFRTRMSLESMAVSMKLCNELIPVSDRSDLSLEVRALARVVVGRTHVSLVTDEISQEEIDAAAGWLEGLVEDE